MSGQDQQGAQASGDELPLALLLLRASRWFDGHLLEALQAEGWPRLMPAQSLVFAQLAPGGIAPAELARRLRISRQATQELVAGLAVQDVLEVVDDPARSRGRLVRLTPHGRRLTAAARAILNDLEHQLGDRRSAALRELLTPFASPYESDPALNTG
ncbi:MarR family winged helix-turn-helix transcriptional regulator [Curtobacterium sp. Leaf261]|uniref:MarR family winged helix-turn-helix transcriptional regulator n=1 Tax=Curtobacterium sp. Leaf261 TaxID=1736311 RepID=UPI0006F4FB65|nr:MarR family winged helix-turn-helix transcriptional regulator [Curtobacterium sp. Leaf261]KQO64322.1 hypothetical protein ASF23_17350 [Curtobacterium sp. Leaf261]